MSVWGRLVCSFFTSIILRDFMTFFAFSMIGCGNFWSTSWLMWALSYESSSAIVISLPWFWRGLIVILPTDIFFWYPCPLSFSNVTFDFFENCWGPVLKISFFDLSDASETESKNDSTSSLGSSFISSPSIWDFVTELLP